ncbi:MAG: MFS transporter [Propionibacteriales bacterium]|nr:MFS transporter [Propionibacteriales bacterium]
MGPLTRLLSVRVLLDVQFWFPTWMIFLLGQGYTPLQAALVDAIFNAVVVLAEVPMGRLVDRIGRKPALLITCGLTTVVFAGIGLVDTVWLMAAVWALGGLLWALASGLDTTYAWELAEARPSCLSPMRYLGRTRLAGGLAGVVSLLSAGYLLEVWAPLPYLVTSGLGLIALLVAFTVPAIPRPKLTTATVASVSLRSAVRLPAVRTGIALGAIVLTAGISIRILFQPLGLELGLSAFEIGIGYAMIAVAVALGGWFASHITLRHRSRWIAASVGLMALSFLLVTVTAPLRLSWLTVLAVLPLGTAAFGMGKTLTDIWLVEAVGPQWRASVLSLASAANGLAMVALRPTIVLVGESSGNTTAFLLWGLVSVAFCLLCLLLTRRPVRRPAEPPLPTRGVS